MINKKYKAKSTQSHLENLSKLKDKKKYLNSLNYNYFIKKRENLKLKNEQSLQSAYKPLLPNDIYKQHYSSKFN